MRNRHANVRVRQYALYEVLGDKPGLLRSRDATGECVCTDLAPAADRLCYVKLLPLVVCGMYGPLRGFPNEQTLLYFFALSPGSRYPIMLGDLNQPPGGLPGSYYASFREADPRSPASKQSTRDNGTAIDYVLIGRSYTANSWTSIVPVAWSDHHSVRGGFKLIF